MSPVNSLIKGNFENNLENGSILKQLVQKMKSSTASSVAVISDDQDIHGEVTTETQVINFNLIGYTDEARSGKVI